MNILVLALLLTLSFPSLAEEPVDPLFVPPPPAPTEPVPDWLKYQDPYAGGQKNISAAHRSAEEVTTWVSNTAAEAMSFEPATFNNSLLAIKPKFTAQGWNEYATWLKESQMLDMVRDRKYGVSTIANGDASILNSGTVAGAFHWIVDVPLIITFVETAPDGEQTTTNGGKHRLSMQIGRVAKGADEAGIAIEGWKVSPIK